MNAHVAPHLTDAETSSRVLSGQTVEVKYRQVLTCLSVSDRKRLSTMIVPDVPVDLTASHEVTWLLCSLSHVQGRQMHGDT